ncbi:MAG: transposase, partial [Deltaproteobacteria bacterium]
MVSAGNAARAQPRANGSAYRRREPEGTVLHATVRSHFKTFLAQVEERGDGAGLPRFVVSEFERYLACGILANGFARVRCASCGDEMLVAFSCKGRGFCPSCTTRRMQGTATHLLDRVLPRAPMRQWVLSLPRWARFLLAHDPKLITRTLDLALRTIFKFQRRRGRRADAKAPRTGAVTFVQRFGGALNLNVHFHCLVPDGVFVEEQPGIRFVPLPGPSEDEVRDVLRRIARRVRKLLRPRAEATDSDSRDRDALAAAQADSVGSLRGRPPDGGRKKERTAYEDGFSLHAGVHLHANDREGLAHLCGYGARPPLVQTRLSQLADGRLAYLLKRPLADGTEVLVLEPCELLRRLAALVPPPRAHLVRYHGVFAPASAWRSRIVPNVEPIPCEPVRPDEQTPPSQPLPSRRPDSRIPWAELLLRVFREDVLLCPCGGRRVVVAFITEKKVVTEILEHLGLPTTGPPIAAARTTASDRGPALAGRRALGAAQPAVSGPGSFVCLEFTV